MHDKQQEIWDKAAEAIAVAFGTSTKEAMIMIDSYVASTQDTSLKASELKAIEPPVNNQPGNRHERRKREALARK